MYSNDVKIDNEILENNCNGADNFIGEKNDFDLVSSDEEENKITYIQSGTNTYQKNKGSSAKNKENNINN